MNRMRTWSLGAAGVAVLVLVAGWFLLVSPTKSKVSDLNSQTAAQQASNASPADPDQPAQAAEQEPPQAGGEAGADPAAPAGQPGAACVHQEPHGDRARGWRQARGCRPGSPSSGRRCNAGRRHADRLAFGLTVDLGQRRRHDRHSCGAGRSRPDLSLENDRGFGQRLRRLLQRRVIPEQGGAPPAVHARLRDQHDPRKRARVEFIHDHHHQGDGDSQHSRLLLTARRHHHRDPPRNRYGACLGGRSRDG